MSKYWSELKSTTLLSRRWGLLRLCLCLYVCKHVNNTDVVYQLRCQTYIQFLFDRIWCYIVALSIVGLMRCCCCFFAVYPLAQTHFYRIPIVSLNWLRLIALQLSVSSVLNQTFIVIISILRQHKNKNLLKTFSLHPDSREILGWKKSWWLGNKKKTHWNMFSFWNALKTNTHMAAGGALSANCHHSNQPPECFRYFMIV